jgi:hypothetical protein
MEAHRFVPRMLGIGPNGAILLSGRPRLLLAQDDVIEPATHGRNGLKSKTACSWSTTATRSFSVFKW